MLKGRKQKYSERWSVAEMKSNIPVLMSTPVVDRLRRLAIEIRRENQTRKKETSNGQTQTPLQE